MWKYLAIAMTASIKFLNMLSQIKRIKYEIQIEVQNNQSNTA